MLQSIPERTFTPQSVEVVLDRIAKGVVERRLEVPVMFFLESHLPVVTLCHTITLLLEPVATPLFGGERVLILKQILADRTQLERLLEKIEALSTEKRQASA